jgi:small subunit ribosomal protein S9
VIDEEETPQDETPQEDETSDISPQTSEEEPAAEEQAPPEEEEAAPAAEEPKREKPKKDPKKKDEPEVIPGADLEPDLVLEESGPDPALLSGDAEAQAEAVEEAFEEAQEPDEAEPDRAVTTVLELAADARYQATGERKRAVARVTLRPGKGEYTVNGRELAEFFPRPTLQKVARGPLETAGQQERLDVVAKIHGGGVSSQAGALRHGIARALVEADPALRGELKRRGFLTRDPRVKERKQAGLKKARKRPQFSKR